MLKHINIFWFRRDLRWADNHAFSEACKQELPILCIFIYDSQILSHLNVEDKRIHFIQEQLKQLNRQLPQDAHIHSYYGTPLDVFKTIRTQFKIQHIFTNTDYEPYARQRDQEIADFCIAHNTQFHSLKDQVIFEPEEITKKDGSAYQIYTPYSKRWLANFEQEKNSLLQEHPTQLNNILKSDSFEFFDPKTIGFNCDSSSIPAKDIPLNIINDYDKTRDFPGTQGTTRLSIHLRFGTISIRNLVKKAANRNLIFLKELIWREFYMMILYFFPHTAIRAFKPLYDRILWENNESFFECWKKGRTGFPIVDAGMRELNASGYMHNRLRMITASFLCKDLLIDWRWGESYFAEKLLDYELASNVGGWQWAAGSGCDAAPYFRIFNPELQAKKFDPDFTYIKKWVPEWGTSAYPQPIIDRSKRKELILQTYRQGLNKD